MKRGDSVQVNFIWASGGNGGEPFRTWAGGYQYLGRSPFALGCLLVRRVGGMFEGSLFNYRPEDVRPA